MDEGMKLYYDYAISPLGKLFYKTVWSQLKGIQNKRILDFGSGFAFTSNYLAQNNDVVALEMNEAMIDAAQNTQTFSQICGDLETVKEMKDETYDVIVCHLVLEFTENPEEILTELLRVLKKGGIVSVVRHNRCGRIIQAVVQDYDLNECEKLLRGEYSYSSAFGNIKYYENEDVLSWAKNKLAIENVFGVRALASLHDEKIQTSENWTDKMLSIEMKLLENPEFVKIAYFNHLILKKT